MKTIFSNAMRNAAQLTHSQPVIEATRVIQRALTGRNSAHSPEQQPACNLRPIAPKVGARPAESEPPIAGNASAGLRDARPTRGLASRATRPLGEVLTLLRQGNRPSLAPGAMPLGDSPIAPPLPEGAAFLTRTFSCAAGSRDYKVYLPSHVNGRKRSLIMMLHGCTQNPDDFAVGTGMNLLAEEQGFIVAYPRQPATANHSACWNWFDRKDQMRDAGEPSIIAGITRAIMAEFDIDAGRVYVAGLSAGGAMALIMSATYPELYAAAGVHSGLAYRSATDLPSAFAAMGGKSSPAAMAQKKTRPKGARVRTIVFHGESDRTVHPSNAGLIVADARAGFPGAAQETQHGRSAGGRAYTRTSIRDARGVVYVEHWAIEGLGHGWSGGRPEGSYTDPDGPDASREMLRFFLSAAAPSATRQ
ncbi:MAG: PHB depolymerase family esterase [Pseudomonadota bacterium]|nr:PHB depolymerase family esterase [Pseudomonadota bacterium]